MNAKRTDDRKDEQSRRNSTKARRKHHYSDGAGVMVQVHECAQKVIRSGEL